MGCGQETAVTLVRAVTNSFGIFNLEKFMLLLFIAGEAHGFFPSTDKGDALSALILVSQCECLPALLFKRSVKDPFLQLCKFLLHFNRKSVA